jgi:hypothetical protein
MNTSTAPQPINRTLHEFIDWLEATHFAANHGGAERGAGSEFAVEPPPDVMPLPECALELALNSDQTVVLSTTSVSVKSVISALILKRAGIKLERVFQGDFTDAEFDALTDTVGAIAKSKFLVELPVDRLDADSKTR